jgi:hypothetical protein
MADVDRLVDQVSSFLFEKSEIISQDRLLVLTQNFAHLRKLTYGDSYAPAELDAAVAAIQTRHTTSMGMGVLFYDAAEYKPWLDDKRQQLTFYYWNRYHQHLKDKYSKQVVDKLDEITDTVLDHLEDPAKEGGWERRGLVVGHVQSGKTANYIGLISKASDAGYKVIIVLGGLLNSLRNQTQERLDSDFAGWCTRYRKPAGVSRFDSTSANPRHPTILTRSVSDFKRAFAQQVAMGLAMSNEPVLLVIKKNVTTLNNLREWLTENNRHNLKDFPLLLIDDEADHASINTHSSDMDPTRINLGIRELLKIFPRSSYVGYTATPFANIFIDPETEHEMTGGELYKDLFPRDFIFSLDPPNNYVGANEVFVDEAQSKRFLRVIDDNEDYLPVRHKRDYEPQMAPSLERAIDCFFLAKTIRELRGQTGKHHSMMINVSRFTDVQEKLKGLVSAFVRERQDAIRNYAGLPEASALKNSLLKKIYGVWDAEYANAGFFWGDVQRQLNASVSSVKVISVNVRSADRLDYSEFQNGRSLIAIGGLGLSRGLTLEGLSVSYFLRNSQMYDTLLQMGRWFGYRDGYCDLCRIFMPDYTASWYAHIAEAVEELRGEFREMANLRLTPIEFGLKVRRHPSALMVTARNKRGTAQTWVREIDLEGRFAETSRLFNDDEVFTLNTAVLASTVKAADSAITAEVSKLGWFWRGVPIAVLEMVVENFRNAPDCLLTTKSPLQEYIGWLKTQKGVTTCDVLLRSRLNGDQPAVVCAGYSVIPVERLLENRSLADKRLTFIKRHISSRGDEQAGIPDDVAAEIQANFDGKNVPDKEYRKYRSANGMPPLLILVLASVAASEKDLGRGNRRKQVGERKVVPAYGISFPGDPGIRRAPEKIVSYEVNATWLRLYDEWAVHETDDETEDEE